MRVALLTLIFLAGGMQAALRPAVAREMPGPQLRIADVPRESVPIPGERPTALQGPDGPERPHLAPGSWKPLAALPVPASVLARETASAAARFVFADRAVGLLLVARPRDPRAPPPAPRG